MVWQTIPDLNIFKCIVLSFLMWFFFSFFLLTLINQPNPYFISHRQSLSDSVRWWLQYIRSCLHFLVALILSFFLLCSYHKYSPHSSQSYAGFFNPWLSFFIYLFFLFILIPSHFCLCFLIFFPLWSIWSNTYWCPTNSHTTPINAFFKNTVYSHLIHHPSHACVSSLSFLPPHGLNVLQGPAGTAAASLSQPGEEPQQGRSFLVFKHPTQEDNWNNTGRFHQPMTKYLGNNICEQKATQIIAWRERPLETVTLIVCFLKNLVIW